MKIAQRTNLFYSIFLCSSVVPRCGVVALKVRSQTQEADFHKLQSTSLSNAGGDSAVASIHKEETHALSSGQTMRYLIAMQTWHRLNRSGIRCPKPAPCQCHCDCPNTEIKPPKPVPTLCPPVLNAWPGVTMPRTTTIVTTTPAPGPMPRKCEQGEVKMSDGTCATISYEVVAELGGLVDAKKTILEQVQAAYDAAYRGANCYSCPGAAKYFAIRPDLIKAHQQYLASVSMYLNAAMAYQKNLEIEKERAKLAEEQGGGNVTAQDAILGPEFVAKTLKRRPHCEPWTAANLSHGAPTRNFCGIICRLQPSCIGFSMEPRSKWCVWYDDTEPEADNLCSTHVETDYVKKRQGPMNQLLWSAIAKVHTFEKAVQEVLTVAHIKMDVANQNWLAIENNKTGNETKKGGMQDDLLASLQNYSGVAYDAFQINRQLNISENEAFALTIAEVGSRPPFGPDKLPPIRDKPEVPVFEVREGLQEPIDEAPKLVNWSDFPNSQDTEWSQMHPDCPMGVPCVCDCKCRGAPPQNFVQPPPPPYKAPCEPVRPPIDMSAYGPMLSNMAQSQAQAAEQFGFFR